MRISVLIYVVIAIAAASAAASNAGPYQYFRPESMLDLKNITSWDSDCERHFTQAHVQVQTLNIQTKSRTGADERKKASVMYRKMADELARCIIAHPGVAASVTVQEDLRIHNDIDVAYFTAGIFTALDLLWKQNTGTGTGGPGDADSYGLFLALKGAVVTRLTRHKNPLSSADAMLFVAGSPRIAELLLGRQKMFDAKVKAGRDVLKGASL